MDTCWTRWHADVLLNYCSIEDIMQKPSTQLKAPATQLKAPAMILNPNREVIVQKMVDNMMQANWNSQFGLRNKLVLSSDQPIRICGHQRPQRWTKRVYYRKRSLPSLPNTLSFFSSLLLFSPPPPPPLTPATQARWGWGQRYTGYTGIILLIRKWMVSNQWIKHIVMKVVDCRKAACKQRDISFLR